MRKRGVLAASASIPFSDCPPKIEWGRSEKNKPRRGEAATFRRRISDWHDKSWMFGVAIARRRRGPDGRNDAERTERVASREARGRHDSAGPENLA